jgi:hypothetical protein
MKSRPGLLRSCLRIHNKGQELLEVILERWAGRITCAAPCAVPPLRVGRGVGPVWTSDREPAILQTIHHLIDHADRDLLLATFSLNGLSDDPDLLHEPLRAAIGRGVRVRLLARSRNFAATRTEAAALADLGVEVYGDDRTHAKCVIADARAGALFSANFDAEHGLYGGVEMGVRLDGEPALTDALHFFDHCIAHAPQTLVRDPDHQRADRALVSQTLSPWPWPTDIPVRCGDHDWNLLHRATGPVLYSARRSEDSEITLHAAGAKWRLSRPTKDRPSPWPLQLIEPPPQEEPPPTALLDTWLSPRRGVPDPYENHRRGLCPATLSRN